MLDLGGPATGASIGSPLVKSTVFCFGASADVAGGGSSITNERMPSRSSSSADAGPR